MILPPGATNADMEKRDRNMAKVIIDAVGLEPEKYRLGYTKVGVFYTWAVSTNGP